MIKVFCDLHKVKFMDESYCEKWKASNYIKSLSGSGSSTLRRCKNCYYNDNPMLKEPKAD